MDLDDIAVGVVLHWHVDFGDVNERVEEARSILPRSPHAK